MVQDSAGFQSQQFVEQIEERRDRYSQQNIDTARNTWGQVGNLPGQFLNSYRAAKTHRWAEEDRNRRIQQDEQEAALRKEQVASDLANDQLHRQQALEDLQWSQQLHQADMIGLQKRGMAAEIALKEAQTKKAIDELGGERVPYAMLTPERMDYAISELGIMANPSDNMRIRPATPDERSAAGQRIKSRQQQGQQYELEQIRTRNEGRSDSDALDTRREMSVIKDRISFLQTELDSMQVPKRGASDEERDAYARKRASIEREIRDLARQASQIGSTQQLGPGRVQSAQPEMTVDDYLSRQSSDALKMLYPGGK